MIKVADVIPNTKNPRSIKDAKFEKLVNSIKDFPKMMELRPIIIDENNQILAGNMRFHAIKILGHKKFPEGWIKKAQDLTEAEKQEFIVKDNVSSGEWDWDLLANEFEMQLLSDWGLSLPFDPNLVLNLDDMGPEDVLDMTPKGEKAKTFKIVFDTKGQYKEFVEWFTMAKEKNPGKSPGEIVIALISRQ